MNDIISQIEKIREINKQHKLVIFVGAGVSKNSGVCSWWELVKEIAQKIGYNDTCEKCQMKHLLCSECGEELELCSYNNYNCYYRYNFSTNDFLKIPQYFYDIYGEEVYNNFLKEKFCRTFTPNEINNLIIDLNPEHIITTNYDHLLEDVKHPNRSKYKIIKNDKDILGEYGIHYIIKMHGDINEIEKVVLKEDDYLKYSQNHMLIETYIKSLLIDKTFLFIGYSLNDNNLSLIMSYIDYFAKENKIKRSVHYLTTNEISNKDREITYWRNKGIELVDLSQINNTMKMNTKCDKLEKEQGKQLYSFLKYIKNDKLPYSNDKTTNLKKCLLETASSLNMFNYINYTTLLKMCNLSHPVQNINGSIYFYNEYEYKLFETIFKQYDEDSNRIKHCFVKAGIHAIQCKDKNYNFINYEIKNDFSNTDDKLFELSLQNNYLEITKELESRSDNFEKAYYYLLIYRTSYDKCQEIMTLIENDINSLNYNELSAEDKYKIAIFEYNTISLRLLNFQQNNHEEWDKLTELLDNASAQNKAFDYIKELCGDNGKIINTLNNKLVKHEEYYMQKSTISKLGGTIYGDLFDLQCIVYDYYFFYKKNYLMLDWFDNVEKICEPYVKAILCTYYPDEYQYSDRLPLGRTQVEPYPLTLMDIDIFVKHTKLNKLKRWVSNYKVSSINMDDEIDIAELFENFCISMRNFWNIYLMEQLEVFSLLISLVKLTPEQKHRILNAFIKLVTPDKDISIRMLSNSLTAIWLFVNKHYDKSEEYVEILKLLIDKDLIKDFRNEKNVYENLIKKLSCHANNEIYDICSNIIFCTEDNSKKSEYTFLYFDILKKFDYDYWHELIINSIKYNSQTSIYDVYEYIQNGTIEFDNTVREYFSNKIKSFDVNKVNGVYTYPNHEIEAIKLLIILLLTNRIPDLDDIKFLEQYVNDSDYLHFLFHPDSFDYSKIKTADYMWCNLINNDKYRPLIIEHKSDFWTKDDEKRIELGFGSGFENRVAYKYLFE